MSHMVTLRNPHADTFLAVRRSDNQAIWMENGTRGLFTQYAGLDAEVEIDNELYLVTCTVAGISQADRHSHKIEWPGHPALTDKLAETVWQLFLTEKIHYGSKSQHQATMAMLMLRCLKEGKSFKYTVDELGDCGIELKE